MNGHTPNGVAKGQPSKAPGKAPGKAAGKAAGKAVKAGKAAKADKAKGQPKAGAPRAPRRRRNRGVLFALAVAMLACIGLLAVTLLNAGTLCSLGGPVHHAIQAYCP